MGRDLLLYALVLTGIVLSPAWWVTLPLVLLAGLTVAALFVLGHDAAHGVLTDDNRLNNGARTPSAGARRSTFSRRGCSVTTASTTVTPCDEGMDFVWHPVTVDQYRDMGSLLRRLRHRMEWSPRVVPLPVLPARGVVEQDDPLQGASGQVGCRHPARSLSCSTLALLAADHRCGLPGGAGLG